MNISGIGIVFTRGRGIERYADALQQGWIPPSPGVPYNGIENFGGLPQYRVEDDVIKDKAVLRKLRRADRFSKMAALSAWDAVQDSGISSDGSDVTGIIVATAWGPHVTTSRFLDDILDYGEAGVSPTIFSNSVHNAAVAYISLLLNTRGPTLTVTQFSFPFQQALILARAWLDEERCDRVLLGCVEERGPVMEYIYSQKLNIAGDGKIRPFHFSESPRALPGEGSVFFMITREPSPGNYCEISEVSFSHGAILRESSPDICILDADGMAPDERMYQDAVTRDVYTAGYAPVFGSMMVGSGFHCAAAALMLKNQIRYACPVQENPHDLLLCTRTEEAEIREICCVKCDSDHGNGVIRLIREPP
ncbi:beta-ketoacyl synthase chain length factor [Desulfococcaceae bacterium HSG8]|nr:beta-ketoacyl synthase chain length factor [Desulfococcaceae bacterium HSG8]